MTISTTKMEDVRILLFFDYNENIDSTVEINHETLLIYKKTLEEGIEKHLTGGLFSPYSEN